MCERRCTNEARVGAETVMDGDKKRSGLQQWMPDSGSHSWCCGRPLKTLDLCLQGERSVVIAIVRREIIH